MQAPQDSTRSLLTALEVQELLHIDRSTVYRMAEDGRLPAIRVGRSWRFPADRIAGLLAAPDGLPAPADVEPLPASANPALDAASARTAVQVAADLLGVMMVVTDMHGRPVTEVANPCPRFRERAQDPATLEECIAEWRDLADHPDLAPRFQEGVLGFQCARAFVRSGSTLVGMVLAGGVATPSAPAAEPDLYHLDDAQRHRVLTALPRIAAAISTRAPRTAASTTKEDQ